MSLTVMYVGMDPRTKNLHKHYGGYGNKFKACHTGSGKLSLKSSKPFDGQNILVMNFQ